MEQFVRKHQVLILLLSIGISLGVICIAIWALPDLGPAVALSLLGLAPIYLVGCSIALVVLLRRRAREKRPQDENDPDSSPP